MSSFRRETAIQMERGTPPEGYSLTDYTRKAYDTGVVPNNKIIELDYRSTGSGNFWQIFGIQGNYCFYQGRWEGTWVGFLNSPNAFRFSNNEYTLRHTVKLSPAENKVCFDGAVAASTSASHTDTALTFTINGIKKSSGSGWWSEGTSGVRKNEIYSLKVWDGTTKELELYALPVVEDGTNVEHMYDFVGKRFLTEV